MVLEGGGDSWLKILTKFQSPKDWRMIVEGGGDFNVAEEVSRWAWIWEDESSEFTYKPAPLDSLYIWAGLSLFTLESGGHTAYIETHPSVR
jgi:hypothetical protein